ncbi:MAG: hypothetical protein CSB55_07555 [Candidatus Cloacimonadota bacterium]|nr:MAG: hypothetical protein CSB55_07555 [Candidatus Cloacimonadota bacterium]
MEKTVYLVRHGIAEHLKFNRRKKMSSREVWELLQSWYFVSLTPEGAEKLYQTKEKVPDGIKSVWVSPLKRAIETSEIISDKNYEIVNELSEIMEKPPLFPDSVRLSVNFWIVLSTVKRIVNLGILKDISGCKKIIRKIKYSDDPVLIVSHEARILSLIIYAKMRGNVKIFNRNVKPGGISKLTFYWKD